MLTSRKYKNPPLAEAVCEFLFESSSAWDPAIPDRVHAKVQDTFPKRRSFTAFEVLIEPNPEGVQQRLFEAERSQFLSDDETALVQISPDLLAVNHLAPYPHWEGFKPLIERALAAYRDVSQPKSLSRITLNYINRISFQGESVDLDQYFNFFPYVGEELPNDHFDFTASVQFPRNAGRDILQIRLSDAPPFEQGTLSVSLDLLYFVARVGEVSFKDVSAWLDEAHTSLGQAFEGCIKDSLRLRFEEE